MNDFLTLEKQLCFSLYQTSNEFTKLYTSALQPFGLTYPQYLLLLALWEKDHVTMKELGERLSLGTGTLNPMITRMEANGWLRKERSKEDERKVYITLQPKAYKEKQPITMKIADEIQTCQIELAEYEALMQGLNQLRQKIKERNQN
ncbi:MarR family transcriptional regulator [Mesobacillus maritimus]|uniref:MarR family winged helix-turn-helix transcriptional regulator n=1 Tax=Mesobacillus maritimus TaxID=1643336 RepID=UPI00203EC7A1|nr:MarR family transcriptional regulator [Mesobacillus maritimus]MCM3587422.1 MarR family transcriptional regulator [Mesobacillus maritimus]MCM3667982.1 MarR family transcriptional regulator [Mesobacillus maritimus]